jgi:hypothetical protein
MKIAVHNHLSDYAGWDFCLERDRYNWCLGVRDTSSVVGVDGKIGEWAISIHAYRQLCLTIGLPKGAPAANHSRQRDSEDQADGEVVGGGG